MNHTVVRNVQAGFVKKSSTFAMRYVTASERRTMVFQMTHNDYMNRMKNDPGWKPGLDAIHCQLEKVYGEGKVHHAQADILLGRNVSLEGFFYAATENSCLHIVTSGLSNISASSDAFGNPVSGWGYELTVKWPGSDLNACHDVLLLLNRVVTYMQVKRQRFCRMQMLPLKKLIQKSESIQNLFAGILFVDDTDLPSIETVHGRVDFLQIVNITPGEIAKLKQNRHFAYQLVFNLQKTYPKLQMDVQRNWDCLE